MCRTPLLPKHQQRQIAHRFEQKTEGELNVTLKHLLGAKKGFPTKPGDRIGGEGFLEEHAFMVVSPCATIFVFGMSC